MTPVRNRSQIALAATAALGAAAFVVVPPLATAAKRDGTYQAGDIHNHTTCSDGSTSMQKLVKKSTDRLETPWGLDWFVQAGHGGSGNRNCTLVEDASLATPAYPLKNAADGTPMGPTTTWQNSGINPKGRVQGNAPSQVMWRWQSIQEFQYPVLEYLAAYRNKPMFLGVESVGPGHEHINVAVITGQMETLPQGFQLPAGAGYSPLGNANAMAQWEYCFDRNDTDTSRGNSSLTSGVGNNWDCSVPGSLNAADPSWNAAAAKLVPAGGTGTGNRGHAKTLEALKWMAHYHPNGSYYIPTHLERAGPFNPDGNNGFNIEHLRNFNNTAPRVAFGMETQPGHGASSERGEYSPGRNTIGGVRVDSVGGTTWGGTGVYGAQIGGVWDALLGEGRNWWFIASSDWHNRGQFGPDDRRSTQDFYPGEYQRNYTMVRNAAARMKPQEVVDGLRTGNTFVAAGQLIDRLSFVACTATPVTPLLPAAVEQLAVTGVRGNTSDHLPANCATMGQKLVIKPGAEVIVAIALRDPERANYAPYTFDNPSLLQVGIRQPLNKPVLDHVDVIAGLVSGYKAPGASDYSGEWPRDWISNPNMANVPAGAKNLTAGLVRSFNSATWSTVPGSPEIKRMSFKLPATTASGYVRLRGTNLPANVPYETDANGNPLPDLHTNATTTTGTDRGTLRIPCTTVGTKVPAMDVVYTGTDIDGCPGHLPTIAGVKYVAYDVAAWADLWFYSNPIYVEVQGGTQVAGLR